MTQEEYIMKRLLELELENKELKEENERLKEAKNVVFRFEDTNMSKHVYKVEFENGNIKVSKENKDE